MAATKKPPVRLRFMGIRLNPKEWARLQEIRKEQGVTHLPVSTWIKQVVGIKKS